MTSVAFTGTSTGVFDVWLSTFHWSGPTLTYSFPTNGMTYNYLSTGAVSPISASQQTAVRAVLGEISGFTGLNFVEISESIFTKGDLRFGTDVTFAGAYAYLPEFAENGGDAFFGPVTDNPQIGNESYLFFTHEIGHAMGLNHGHEHPSFQATGLDSQEFTVVTYTDYVGDTDPFSFDSGPIDWAQTYMQLDIAAMQFLYGANYAQTGEVWSGDTTYTFDPATGEMTINGVGQGTPAGNRIFRTIWDGDGEDTYDLSNYTTDLAINLEAGGWSLFSETQLADLNRFSSSSTFDARGNVANALLVDGDRRALIENAIGGTGNDSLLGNSVGNRLQGLAGHDVIKGKSGADTLVGNSGKDKLFAGNGADTLFGGAGQDWLFGGAGADTIKGGTGNDILVGGVNMDTMTGGDGRDTFRFNFANESKVNKFSDVITDFTSGTDTLDLSRLAPETLTLSIGGGLSGDGPSAFAKAVGDSTRVFVDVDGDGQADFRVILNGTASVTVDDFIL